ncbi:unnamed protein product, partial [Rhizoctonia solani]
MSQVVSAATLIIILALSQRSQPRIDAWVLFILAVLWLTMGAYSQDVIGFQRCYAMKGQKIPTSSGTTSMYFVLCPPKWSESNPPSVCGKLLSPDEGYLFLLSHGRFSYCVITVWWVILLIVVNKIYTSGEHDIWSSPMSDVTMFGEEPVAKRRPEEYPPRDRGVSPMTRPPSAPRQAYQYPYYSNPPSTSGSLHRQQVVQQ